jgi:Protein kinase domain
MFTSLSKNKVLAGKVVLKSSLMKERAKQKLLAEIKIHRDMCHTSIVRFESFFEDKTAVYILLELCANNVSVFPHVIVSLGFGVCQPSVDVAADDDGACETAPKIDGTGGSVLHVAAD